MVGKCLSCAQNTYLDLTTNNCLDVTTKIPNCVYYFSAQTCQACATGYMVSNGVCAIITKAISNCASQQEAVCLACDPGYILSLTGDSCTQNPGTTNCAAYQNVQCNQCAPGYVMNPNLYLTQIYGFQFRSQFDLLQKYIGNQQTSIIDGLNLNVCQQGQDPNCASFITYNKCGTCNSGYFVNADGLCTMFPVQAVPNCIRYSSLTVCVLCAPMFQLNSAGACVPVLPVENCLIYQPNETNSGCLQCKTGFRVLGKRCIPRQNIISNCIVFDNDQDACLTCAGGYMTSDDLQNCLPTIANCLRYAPSNRFTRQLTCEQCSNGFYLNPSGSTCLTGKIPNCMTYERQSNTCVICNNKYYMENGQCLPQYTIFGCNNYHFLSYDICTSCKSSALLTTNIVSCESVNQIAGCQVYLSKNKCFRCQDGYTLLNNQCSLINPAENCLQKTRNYCTKCLKDFINDKGVCRSALDRVVINCDRTNLDGIVTYSQNTCSVCKENSVPLNYKDHYVCTESSFVSAQAGLTLDPNCLQYRVDTDGVYRCSKCDKQMILSATFSCVTTCPTTLYRQTLINDLQIGNNRLDALTVDKINFCGTKITNCAIAAPDLHQPYPNNPRYTCVSCDPNTIQIINLSSPSSSIIKNPLGTPAQMYGVSPVSFSPGIICVDPITNTPPIILPNPAVNPGANIRRLGDFSGFSVPNCEYYSVIEPGLGCVKCSHAYTGNVLTVVSQCARYRDTYTCLECNQGFFLAFSYECRAVIPLTNCASYSPTASTSTCVACVPDYYLNAAGTACVLRVRSRNVLNSVTLVSADDLTCRTGFVKLPPAGSTSTAPYTCTQLPSNCLTAQIANDVITGCTACNPVSSYISGSNCVVGTISNCVGYNQAAVNTCVTCANKYYLSANQCLAHNFNQNSNCLTFDQTTQNICQTCNALSFKFTPVNQCRLILTIPNCLTYDSTTSCSVCKTGYRLANLRTACNLIPSSENCSVMTPVSLTGQATITPNDADSSNEFVYKCDTCLSGFYKVSVSKTFTPKAGSGATSPVASTTCVSYLSYKLQNCQENNVVNTATDTYTAGCQSCQASSHPIDFSLKYVCTERAYQNKVHAGAPNIAGCEVMTLNSGAYICSKCIYPKILNAGTCVDQCPTATDVFNVQDYSINTDSYAKVAGACAALPGTLPANCAMMTPLIDDMTTINYGCIACNTGFYPAYKIGTGGVPFNPTLGDKVDTPFDAYPIISHCLDASTYRVMTAQTGNYVSVIPNCRYYFHLENTGGYDYVGCGVCNYGYTGVLTKYLTSASPAVETAFIPECMAMPTTGSGSCLANSSLAQAKGLGLSLSYFELSGPLSLLYSCLQCTTATELPSVALAWSTDRFTDMLQYDISSSPWRPATLSATQSPQTLCRVPPADIPANCGLVAYASNAAATNVINSSYFCTACKPGFTPTFGTIGGVTNYNVITACTAIPFCTTGSSWFNTCSNCVFQYDYVNKVVQPNVCVNTTDTTFINSCFAGNRMGKCLICKKGFDMNWNGTCVQANVPSCTSYNLQNPLKDFFFRTADPATATYTYLTTLSKISIYFLEDNLGCNSCSSTMILTQVPDTANAAADPGMQKLVCVSQAISKPSVYTIPNCQFLAVNAALTCFKCVTGFVLTTTGTCISQSLDKSLINCALALVGTRTYCNTCTNPTDINVGGMCVPIASTNPNCLTFDLAASKINPQAVCTLCKDLFFVDQNGLACTPIPAKFPNCAQLNGANTACQRCVNNFVLVTLANSVNYCFPTLYTTVFDSNCLSYDPANFGSRNLNCASCATGYFPVAVSANTGNFCNNFQLNPNPLCATYDLPADAALISTASLKCTSCVNNNLQFFDLTASNCIARKFLDTNCATFATNADECSVCATNYVLEPIFKRSCIRIPFVTNFNPLNKSYLKSCAPMTTCSASVYYEGLSRKVASLVSCHSCTVAGQIPFLVGRGGWPFTEISGLQSYALSITPSQRYMDLNGDTSTRCLAPSSSALGIPSNLFSFPTNCGVGFINANAYPDSSNAAILLNVDRTKLSAVCVACAPGFAAQSSVDNNQNQIADMVGSCTQIANCESSTWFNYCTQCAANYVYNYDPVIGVRYDQCILYDTNQNCFAVDVKSVPGKKICKYCKSGYSLNFDGICELIRPPRCFISNYRGKEFYPTQDLPSGLVLSREGTGCQKCDTGFVGLLNSSFQNICTQSPYFASNSVQAPSSFIFQCKTYTVTANNRLKCSSCYAGYILRVDGRCVSNTNQQQCIIGFDEQNCSRCNLTTSAIVDHQCAAQNITNCVEYSSLFSFSSQVCTRCAPGFYLDANFCRSNSISNCAISDSLGSCTKCASGFERIRSANTNDYCFNIDRNLNCTALDQGWLQRNKLACLNCSSSAQLYLSEQPFEKSICLNVNPLDNCLTYDVQPAGAASTFQCTQCTSQYYLDSLRKCQRRTLNEPNCSAFSLTDDKCISCIIGFYLSSNGKSCVAYPTGISFCRVYSYRDKCASCQAQYYLKNNRCLLVPIQNLIPNCMFYDDQNTCKACNNSYAVTDGKCVASTAQNCLEYQTSTSCATCPDGYGLKEDNGLVNCVIISVENCALSTKTFPFTCITCKSGYFVRAGVCVATSVTISSCLIYATSDTCAQCDYGTALASDGASCVKISSFTGAIDPNCQISTIRSQKQCVACKAGFFFKNGGCQQCSTQSGCFGCLDSDPNTCQLCAPGYYMTSDRKCLVNGSGIALNQEQNVAPQQNLYYSDYRKLIN